MVPVKNSNLLANEDILKDGDTGGDIFDAARSGDIASVKAYLDLGVPVDLTDEDGWSPVHHAIAHGQVEVIRLLMDRGCRMVPVKNSNLLANEDILKDGDTGGDDGQRVSYVFC
jgi:ankyrin repeat protein